MYAKSCTLLHYPSAAEPDPDRPRQTQTDQTKLIII